MDTYVMLIFSLISFIGFLVCLMIDVVLIRHVAILIVYHIYAVVSLTLDSSGCYT